ncbi:MAG: hypothetical protein L3J05_08615, partial [Robiginitomaculum sp.]|nr:hypothetical protein [Robiginitomaculum sp.]
MFARKFIFVIFSVLLIALVAGVPAFAQSDSGQSPLSVPFTETEIKASITTIEADTNFSDEDKAQIIDLYKNALAKISEGKASEMLAKNFAAQLDNAPGLIKVLERDTIDVRKTLRRSRADMMRDYSAQNLEDLEQNLVQERAKATTLRGLKSQYERERQTLDVRPAQALEEIATLEQSIAGRIANLNNANSENVSKLEQAATALSRANLYAERQKKRALEQEIASIAARRKVLDKRISLNAAQINQSNDLVSALQERTGFARTDDALVRLEDAKREAEEFLSDHPVVQAYALENVVLAQQNLDIAKSEGDLPEKEADISIKLQQVRLDANVTKQILDSRKVNKAYGEHLRSLRKKQPSVSTIQQQIKKREIDLQDALFQRITTQEGLDIFNATSLDIAALKRVYDLQNGATPALSETDTEHLQRAYDSRRGHLNELATVSSLRTR